MTWIKLCHIIGDPKGSRLTFLHNLTSNFSNQTIYYLKRTGLFQLRGILLDSIFFSICIPYKSNTFLTTPSKLLFPWSNLCLLRHNEYSPLLLFITSVRRNNALLKEPFFFFFKGSYKETINIFLMTGFSKQKDLLPDTEYLRNFQKSRF